jgi:hypothetical protein
LIVDAMPDRHVVFAIHAFFGSWDFDRFQPSLDGCWPVSLGHEFHERPEGRVSDLAIYRSWDGKELPDLAGLVGNFQYPLLLAVCEEFDLFIVDCKLWGLDRIDEVRTFLYLLFAFFAKHHGAKTSA